MSCMNNKSLDDKNRIYKLVLESDELSIVIDSLITHEKQMNYYSSDLLFTVHIQKHQEVTLIQVGSLGKCRVNIGNELGWFYRNDNLFIVSGDCLDQTLFKPTEVEIDQDIYNHIFCHESEEIGIIEVYENDEFTYWDFIYRNGKFVPIKY